MLVQIIYLLFINGFKENTIEAEAERERRAKVIHAEGELQASEKLLQAAQVLAQQSQALQLRYLQTLTEIAGEGSSTIVFPLPIEGLGQLGEWLREKRPAGQSSDPG